MVREERSGVKVTGGSVQSFNTEDCVIVKGGERVELVSTKDLQSLLDRLDRLEQQNG